MVSPVGSVPLGRLLVQIGPSHGSIAQTSRNCLARTEVLEPLGRCSRNVLDSDWPYWNTYENDKFVCAALYVRPGGAVVWSAEGVQLGPRQR
jgi:hypothetical protein